MHSMSRYYRYINQNTPTTLTHTTTTAFSDPLSADFTNTHAHERSLREVNFDTTNHFFLQSAFRKTNLGPYRIHLLNIFEMVNWT